MSFSDWIQVLAATATVLLLVAACFTDITRYRIPNAIVYAIVAAFAVYAIFNGAWPQLGWSVLAATGMFLLGAGLFALGLFGGGDVKLIAAMALWMPLSDLPHFLIVMTLAGGILGLIWLLRRRLSARPSASTAAAPSDGALEATAAPARPNVPNRLPYGVAIALAGIDYFFLSVHSPFAPLLPWS